MPISDTDGYPIGHWAEVKELIVQAAGRVSFKAEMVSENVAEDMIQASIVRNIYQNHVVVCDVSSLNPNVMLELGLRMATQLPLIVVFDGEAKYPFDINSILHARYPKSLNHKRMEVFMDELGNKIRTVYDAQQKSEYKPFLSHFSEVKVEAAKLEPSSQTVIEALQTVLNEMSTIRTEIKMLQPSVSKLRGPYITSGVTKPTIEEMKRVDELASDEPYGNARAKHELYSMRDRITSQVIIDLYGFSDLALVKSRKNIIANYAAHVIGLRVIEVGPRID